jgi:cholesterol transport system auxiliary component
MMSRVRVAVALLTATLLGGCSGLLLGPKNTPVTTYLFAPELPEGRLQGRGPSLSVSRPRAAAGYRTAQMAYLERDYRVDYFAHNEWVDSPAGMLRPLLSTALRSTGRFGAVTEDARGVDSDLRLDTFIVQVHQDFRTTPSRASVILRAQLVDRRNRRILATGLFKGEEAAPAEDPYGGVVAVNRVLNRLLGQIAEFAVDATAGL